MAKTLLTPVALLKSKALLTAFGVLAGSVATLLVLDTREEAGPAAGEVSSKAGRPQTILTSSPGIAEREEKVAPPADSAPVITPASFASRPLPGTTSLPAPTQLAAQKSADLPTAVGATPGSGIQPVKRAPYIDSQPLAAEAGLTVNLAPGVHLPIVLAATPGVVTPAQAEALAAAGDDFLRRVEEAADTLDDEELAEAWKNEREQADSQYRILFGDAAFNQRSMESALKTLGLPLGPGPQK